MCTPVVGVCRGKLGRESSIGLQCPPAALPVGCRANSKLLWQRKYERPANKDHLSKTWRKLLMSHLSGFIPWLRFCGVGVIGALWCLSGSWKCEVPVVGGHLIVSFLSCILGFLVCTSCICMYMLEASKSCSVLGLFFVCLFICFNIDFYRVLGPSLL